MAHPHFEFLVEEPSMESFLRACLPRMLSENCSFDIHPYRGKNAMLRKIGKRLKGYARWMPAQCRIVVVVDRNGDTCEDLKLKLEDICRSAGLRSRRAVGGSDWQIVTRIAIEELEAWYFGDWEAVKAAYPGVSASVPDRPRYRNPDRIAGGTWEAFERVLQEYGYFRQGLAKVQAAGDIGKHIAPARNRSRSFAMFRDAVAEAVA